LHIIPQYLHSPAKAFIQAKGVESVSSPVGNIGLDIDMFQQHLQEEFAAMYEDQGHKPTVEILGEEHLNIPAIKKGYDELKTDDWMWSQTPQFTLAFEGSGSSVLELNVHHGVIQTLEPKEGQVPGDMLEEFRAALVGQKLQDINDWSQFLQSRLEPWHSDYEVIASRLETLLPVL
jgi:lipoate-protein ligase A